MNLEDLMRSFDLLEGGNLPLGIRKKASGRQRFRYPVIYTNILLLIQPYYTIQSQMFLLTATLSVFPPMNVVRHLVMTILTSLSKSLPTLDGFAYETLRANGHDQGAVAPN